MGFGSLAIVDTVVVIVFSLALLMRLNPWLTLWSMMAMPFIPIVVRYFGGQIFRVSRETQRAGERSQRVRAGRNFSGIRV